MSPAAQANTRLHERQRVRTAAQTRTLLQLGPRVSPAANWGRIETAQHVTTVPQARTRL